MADAVMVTSSFLPGQGGIESYLAELCGLLRPRLAVLAPGQRDGKPLPSDLGYPVSGGPGSMLVPSSAVAQAIEHQARLHSTDRVVFGTPWPLVLLGPRLRRRGLRYAVIIHGAELLVPAAVPLLQRRVAQALSDADLLVPVSEFTGAAARKLLGKHGLPLPRIETLRARVDLERFHPDADTTNVRARYGIASEGKMILCFGRLVPRKGVDRLITAMPSVTSAIPEAILVVAGTGKESERLEKLAAESGAPIVFTGRVPDADAPALYATADVFALAVADRWFGLEIEGLGVVLLEASACETPCVTGRSGGTPEAVKDGETGLVVDATDQDELTAALVHLLKNDDLRRRMGAAARDHVTQAFSTEAATRPLIDWLD